MPGIPPVVHPAFRNLLPLGTGIMSGPLVPVGAVRSRLPLHPAFRRLPPPVIVIGMHRSGTSLVAAMLARLGVYMGSGTELAAAGADPALRSSGYAEAGEFFRLNELLLRRAGATWDRVEPFLERRRGGGARSDVLLLAAATYGPLQPFLRGLPRGGRGAWGWKDPRSTLTLPYWLALFPEARVLHVRREREATAASVHRRAVAWSEGPGAHARVSGRDLLAAGLADPARAARALLRRVRRGSAAPPADSCLDLDYCRRLCDVYQAECLRYRELGDRYPGDRFMELRYEELIREPWAAAERLARFGGVARSAADLAGAAALVA